MPGRFDFILIVVFLAAQIRITWLLTRAAKRRFTGNMLIAALTGIVAFNSLVLAGYVLSYSDVTARLPFSGDATSIAGAITLTYLIVASGIVAVQFLLQFARKRFTRKMDPDRRRLLTTAGNMAMAAPVAFVGYGFIRRTDFHVREVDVPFAELPHDLDGLRILQLSDIHLSAFLSERELARVIDAAVETKPHLAVITGDLISSRGDPLDACIRQLARVRADAGVFGCMGNHERYAQAEEYTQAAAARRGIHFLRGESQALKFGGATLNVAGVDHQSKAGGKRYLVGAEELVQPGAVNLLLSHNPDVFPVAVSQGYNLLLAGHTHGGQVTVEILDQSVNPARFFTPYVYGLYRSGDAAAYVTRGIGTIGIPARIGAPPEISVLRLRKA